jgi:acyl dehydratase
MVSGPYFDDLAVGDRFEQAPALTLTAGHAAVHQAIVGDRMRLPLDAHLSARVLGRDAHLAHPMLVCDVAIGQSTLATQRVIANLFYRQLVLDRAPVLGDTLATVTEVVALKRNRDREGRPPTGLAVLRMRTTDQEGRSVLDFWRCAMLPVRDPDTCPRHADDLDAFAAELDEEALAASVTGWALDAYRAAVPGGHHAALQDGMRWALVGGDTVTSAPELARLSLNIAMAHTDPGSTGQGRRLVYGGHTIGIAAAHLTRALPEVVSIVGWHSCDHLAGVQEGDVLHSEIRVDRLTPWAGGGGLAHVRVQTAAHRRGDDPIPVLDWRPAVVLA